MQVLPPTQGGPRQHSELESINVNAFNGGLGSRARLQRTSSALPKSLQLQTESRQRSERSIRARSR
jgi:hypothetical protein